MLYLLFYYPDALSLAVGTATAIHFAASDGIISFAVGALIWDAVPLGLAFVATYAPRPA